MTSPLDRILARYRSWLRSRRFAQFTQRQRIREIEFELDALRRRSAQETAR